MSDAKTQTLFLELLLSARVLSFGQFTTKSGRQSPYFFNTGNFNTGRQLSALAKLYAHVIIEHFGAKPIDNLFGPAYKGIPLCVSVATALAELSTDDVSFTFNRKETKDHGEGGSLVGHKYNGSERVVIVEDVLTAGTSLREAIAILGAVGLKPVGAIVGVDRQERGRSTLSARREIEQDLGLPVYPIITMDEVVARLLNQAVLGKVWIDAEQEQKIRAYRRQYCT